MERTLKAAEALGLLRKARTLLDEAGAVRTVAKLRAIMASAEGAVRAAHYRDMREADSYDKHQNNS